MKNSFLIGVAFITTALLSSFTARAEGDSDLGIVDVGLHGGNQFYFTVDRPLSGQCAWGVLYCAPSNPDCKHMLAILLTAKTQDKRLTTINYNKDGGGVCWVNWIAYR